MVSDLSVSFTDADGAVRREDRRWAECDPFALSASASEEAIAACLLGDEPASMAEVAEML